MKHLGINLIKEVKELYTKNYMKLFIKLKKQRNGKIFHVRGLEKST